MWNYRIVQAIDKEIDEDEPVLILAEVYYDRIGNPYGWCNAIITGETVSELKRVHEMIEEAFDKPTLLSDKDFNGDPFL